VEGSSQILSPPFPASGGKDGGNWCYCHTRFRDSRPEVQGRLLISGKQVDWLTPVDLLPAILPASATSMYFQPAKNLIFLHDRRNDFRFLVDSGTSLQVLSYSSSDLHTGPHLVGANGKTIHAWGFHQFSVIFSGQILKFDFFVGHSGYPAWISLQNSY
jgi:hypothetical protein